MCFAKRDFLRAAVFAWNVELLAALSIKLLVTVSNFAAASKSPASAAASAFLVNVRIMLFLERFLRRAFSDWRWYFIAEGFLAMILLNSVIQQ